MLNLPLFRSLVPIHNPLGFGALDFVELFLAVALLAVSLGRGPLERAWHFVACRPAIAALFLAALPVVLRLALLPHFPAPLPDVADEWSHLLEADTLRHLRFANPLHPLHAFFETFFVLQVPTYSSIYPMGQGLVLALGRAIFGSPWAGVLLATSAFCGAAYWALRGWTTRGLALLGGLLCVMQYGPLSQWMNSFWGGAFAATGGCLAIGALPRLSADPRRRDACLLGIGFAIVFLTRPYESIFLFMGIAAYFLIFGRNRGTLRFVALSGAVFAPALVLVAVQNRQVTGSWTTLPYQLSQYQYGVPVSLTVESDPQPHLPLTPQQQSEYAIQRAFKEGGETPGRYAKRFRERFRYLPFYLLPPLLLASLAAFPRIREPKVAWAFGVLALSLLGVNLFPAFHFHYLAPVALLFLLISLWGIEQIAKLRLGGTPAGRDAAFLLVGLCALQFTFWYALHLGSDPDSLAPISRYESWDALNNPRPFRRESVSNWLSEIPGQKLVFVRYYPQHPSQDEWVWNEAEIDESPVVWARDLGSAEDRKLQAYYPRRSSWLLEPDFQPLPRLTPMAR